MVRLPKSIINKYGITKKAWSIFRGKRKTKKTNSKGGKMARRGRKRSSGGSSGFGMSKLLTPKNLAYTVGAAVLLPKVLPIDSRIAGAIGGFMGAGIIGAGAGYFGAPIIANFIGQGTSSNGGYDFTQA